jgi:hypothetical protein
VGKRSDKASRRCVCTFVHPLYLRLALRNLQTADRNNAPHHRQQITEHHPTSQVGVQGGFKPCTLLASLRRLRVARTYYKYLALTIPEPQNRPQPLRFCGTHPFRCVKTFLTFMQQPKLQGSHQEAQLIRRQKSRKNNRPASSSQLASYRHRFHFEPIRRAWAVPFCHVKIRCRCIVPKNCSLVSPTPISCSLLLLPAAATRFCYLLQLRHLELALLFARPDFDADKGASGNKGETFSF